MYALADILIINTVDAAEDGKQKQPVYFAAKVTGVDAKSVTIRWVADLIAYKNATPYQRKKLEHVEEKYDKTSQYIMGKVLPQYMSKVEGRISPRFVDLYTGKQEQPVKQIKPPIKIVPVAKTTVSPAPVAPVVKAPIITRPKQVVVVPEQKTIIEPVTVNQPNVTIKTHPILTLKPKTKPAATTNDVPDTDKQMVNDALTKRKELLKAAWKKKAAARMKEEEQLNGLTDELIMRYGTPSQKANLEQTRESVYDDLLTQELEDDGDAYTQQYLRFR